MKPKGLSVDKNSPDYKKILELSADSDLLASVNQEKPKFFTYLKNKLAPIQEEKTDKSEHKCQQFETATLLTATKTTTGNVDAKSQDVSQKNMPTQLPSTNLNNIESSSSQANTNLQSLGKWNTTPEHIQQVTNNIEKQQAQQSQQLKEHQPAKSVSRHHLPPVTRKTVLGPVPQARSSISHHHLKSSELESNVNYKAIYQPIPNPMATYSSNGQEWLVAKQRIQRPKDHDILTIDPVASGHHHHYMPVRPVTDADIRKQEFLERKIAQEEYRQQLENQIMQQKPVKPFLPRTTLRFDGEAEYKTESRQSYKPFKFVTSLNDLDKRGGGNSNEQMNRKQSIEKEHHTIQMHNHSNMNQPPITSGGEQQTVCCNKGNRPQSSLTGGKFKDHLQNQPELQPSQRRQLNQIQQLNQIENEQAYRPNDAQHQTFVEVDENNNVIDQRPNIQYNSPKGDTFCCDHCRHHYLNGIGVQLGSGTNQNQIELNPLVGVRASQMNKQANRLESSQQPSSKRKQTTIRESQQPIQASPMVRSKSTHFQPQSGRDTTIPRMIVPGKQKPHKNMSHLKFEGQNCFMTTNNMMYRDHSMQNLSSYPANEQRNLNRGVFAEQQMMSSNGAKKSISGNIRGKVKNKHRDLFASSEDIFGNQDYKACSGPPNRLSVKYKSAANLPQLNDEYDGRSYYADDKYRSNYANEDHYESNYANAYRNEYDNEYEANYANSYPNEYQNDYQQQQLANEQMENEDEQYDEEVDESPIETTTKQKRLIFIPKDHSIPTNLGNSGFERRREPNTTNSNYGSQLRCPALNLASLDSNPYEYKYTVGGHKYFYKKSSLS